MNRPLKSWLPLLFVLLTGGTLIMMIFVTLAFQLFYFNRIYPGVMVVGAPVGGMTPPEVEAVARERTVEILARPVTIQAGDQSWTVTTQELGMEVDAPAMAQQAYLIGRQGDFLADMLTHLRLIATPRHVEPIIRYNNTSTDDLLGRLAAQVDYLPQDAQLLIHPDASLELIPAKRGRRFNIEATRQLVEEALFAGEASPVVTAIVQEILPATTEEDLTTAYRHAQNLIGATLVFSSGPTINAGEWRLEPQTLVGMIKLASWVDESGKTQFGIEVDPQKFRPYFAKFALAINRYPVDARLAFDPETATLSVATPGQKGYWLDEEAAFEAVLALKERPDHFIRLPVDELEPTVPDKNLDALGIKELVSESTSYFKGSSAERVHNITLAASKLQNVVVPPGEVFSFNKYVGMVTKEEGYNESLIIYGDRTAVGIGGGVCQVSTTIFRAAMFGGFELIERWAHGYRVRWYETNFIPGMDATVYSPHVDFRFRNDTDTFLLIQTEVDPDAGTLTFRFYGTKPNREVIFTEPLISNETPHGPAIYEDDPTLPQGTQKQVDWAVDGMDVVITRTVKAADGAVIHEDGVVSKYEPWQAVYKVGTGPTAN
jgi:vancomycin resistance protein YoaR